LSIGFSGRSNEPSSKGDRAAPGRWGAAAGEGGPRGRGSVTGSSQYQHFPKQKIW
jgi:hypothetical protein